MAGLETLRLGYLVGTYKQAGGAVRRSAALVPASLLPHTCWHARSMQNASFKGTHTASLCSVHLGVRRLWRCSGRLPVLPDTCRHGSAPAPRLSLQGIDCTQRLVSLQTPLGGEIVAIMRQRVRAAALNCSARAVLLRLRNRLPPCTPQARA